MNDVNALRAHLFATLDGLRDKDKPMDIERAKAIAEVAQVVINSAKVECDHMKLTGEDSSLFIPQKQIPEGPNHPRLVAGSAQSGSR